MQIIQTNFYTEKSIDYIMDKTSKIVLKYETFNIKNKHEMIACNH